MQRPHRYPGLLSNCIKTKTLTPPHSRQLGDGKLFLPFDPLFSYNGEGIWFEHSDTTPSNFFAEKIRLISNLKSGAEGERLMLIRRHLDHSAINTTSHLIIPILGMIIPNMGIKKTPPKKLKKTTTPRKSLIDALFTSTQKKVIGLLFGNPGKKFFATEIIRLAGAGSGAVQRELHALTGAGLVTIENLGKQKYYQANRTSAIFEELRSIIIKTVGLTEPLKNALKNIQEDIDLAFVYGSIAKGTDTATSDIDLLIVSGKLSLSEIYEALSKTEISLGRKINPTLYTPAEFSKRIQNKNSFIENVLSSEYILLVGDMNVVEAAR